MAISPLDAADAEKALYELESFLEKPQSRKHTRTVSFAKLDLPEYAVKKDVKTKLSRTAYLDGLRGFAALLVYSLHHQVWGHSGMGGEFILENAFGWDHKYYLVCFPGIRILFSGGHLAVAIFFVISGYVLTAKPLRLLQALIATTFLWMTSWHLFGIKSSNPIAAPPERTYLDEVWKWYCDFKNYSFIFTGDAWNAYNDHTWSIPMEFRGSIVVYTASLAFSRFKTDKRLLCEVGLIWYFLWIVDGWFCALFMVGMLLADLDLLAEKDQLPAVLARLRPFKLPLCYLMFFAALYLGGVPSITNDLSHLRDSPGWHLLSYLKPQAVYDFRWFFRFWAASLMVACIPHISWLKAFFETAFCRYLGRISFGFYLVHGPVLWTMGDRLYAAVGRVREGHVGVVPTWINSFPFSGWGPFGLELNYLVPHLILLPLTLCLAEAITKLIDEPSVKFAQWAFGQDVAAPKKADP
ncbi:hypothetical protein LTR86_004599 [Recurvomyces mirabilis]|nr:hypothetical protein LTR86_004599 [Recurvomyces mirabilis]